MWDRRGFVVAGIGLAVIVPLLARAATYTTSDPVASMTDNTGTFTACQTITVPSVAGEDIIGTDVDVSISAAHSWIGDLTIRVDPPNGGNLTLMNRPGRTGTGAGASDDLVSTTAILFDDVAPSGILAESMGAGCAGVIGVTPGCPADYIPDPQPADIPIAGEGTNLAQWAALSPVGVWTLCIADSAAGDTGTLASWSLTFNNNTPVELLTFSVE